MTIKYAISACLCGLNCKYNGLNNLNEKCRQLLESGEAIIICPETCGGLSIPRKPCEIKGDKVLAEDGTDCTYEYNLGARLSLEYVKKFPTVDTIILKEKSPSCGSHFIYDGNHNHTKISGMGVGAKLFKEAGYRIISEEELDEL